MRMPRALLFLVLSMLPIVGCDDQDLTAPSPRRPRISTREIVGEANGIAVTSPNDINGAGVIVGSLQLPPDGSEGCAECYGSFVPAIDVDGVGYLLGPIGDPTASNSYGAGINDRGQVVGYGQDYVQNVPFSFVWTPEVPNGTTGTFQLLSPPGGGWWYAFRINNTGQVAGNGRDGTTAVIWTGGQVVELGSPYPGGTSSAADINDYGQVAGIASDASGVMRPMLWTPAVPNGTTGHFTMLCAECTGWAVAINDFGQVVMSTGELWTPSSPNGTTGTIVSLPLVPTHMNNRGNVVGYIGIDTPTEGTSHGALWRPTAPNGSTGTFTDLTPDLGFSYIAGSQATRVAEERDGALKIVGQQWDYVYAFDALWTVTDLGAPQVLRANAGPTAFGNENASVQFNGGSTSPLSDDLQFQWSFGDGSAGTGVTPTHTYADNGQYVVRLTVTDGAGRTSTATTSATIANRAPTASLTVNPSTVNQGSAFTLALVGASDVPADLPSLQFAFDCGDGRGLQAYGSSTTVLCSTVSSGSRSVRGAVRDKDGGTSEYGATFTVLNVAPTVTILSAPASVGAPPTVRVDFRFTDPGVEDAPWSYTINWGDGSVSAPVSLTIQGGTITATHKYQKGRSNGASYTITIQVRDNQGALGQATRTVLAAK